MRGLGFLALIAPLLLLRPATAAMTADLAGGAGCRGAVAAAERAGGVPPGLLGAIARVESGRRDPDSGEMQPWPWTADVEGTGYFYPTKAAAIAAVRRFQAQGVQSIDVGCMQVNLQQHPDAFPSLEAAFDPPTNAAYAARFLNELHDQTGDWGKAAGMYHSATPMLGAEYQRKVLAALPEEQRRVGAAPTAIARAWSASLGTPMGAPFGTAGGIGGAFHRTLATAAPTMAGGGTVGRTLAAYRAMPVRMASMPRLSFFVRR